MINNNFNRVSIILSMSLLFLLASNEVTLDIGEADSYKESYGSYQTISQAPKYDRDMMRYSSHEMEMPGGTDKYSGYNSKLSDETIKKLNAEQETFVKEMEYLRQIIYDIKFCLNAELVKKDPDIRTVIRFQNIIFEADEKFKQKKLEQLIRMEKINLESEN